MKRKISVKNTERKMSKNQEVRREGEVSFGRKPYPVRGRKQKTVTLDDSTRPLRLRANSYRIPEEFDVLPAVVWKDGIPFLFRALIKRGSRRCEKSVKSPRAKRSA